ncbi:MAG: hypothetical protein WBX81_11345 [Nitrososphaeraceae archaeon]|jgi:hypothetical protein
MIAAVKKSSNITFGKIVASEMHLSELNKGQKRLSRINVNNTRSMANTAKETAAFSVSANRRQREGYIS